jgi:hypothetical protein
LRGRRLSNAAERMVALLRAEMAGTTSA